MNQKDRLTWIKACQEKDILIQDLMRLAMTNNINKAEKLLNEGADINYSYANTNLPTALFYATFSDSKDMVKWLISKGANVYMKSNDGCNRALLHVAGEKGNVEIIKLLLEEACDPNARDSKDQTPLLKLIECDHKEAVMILLKAGANIDSTLDHIVAKEKLNSLLAKENVSLVEIGQSPSGVDPLCFAKGVMLRTYLLQQYFSLKRHLRL